MFIHLQNIDVEKVRYYIKYTNLDKIQRYIYNIMSIEKVKSVRGTGFEPASLHDDRLQGGYGYQFRHPRILLTSSIISA